MRKLLIFTGLMLVFSAVFAQKQPARFDAHFGSGFAFLGSGDMFALAFENELRYRLSDKIAAAANVTYGKSDYGVYISTSYVQGNASLLWSPFGNLGLHNFYAGAGFSYMNVSDFYVISEHYSNGTLLDRDHEFYKRDSYGINLLIGYDYRFTKKILGGVTLFHQSYFNNDVITGLYGKLGIRL